MGSNQLDSDRSVLGGRVRSAFGFRVEFPTLPSLNGATPAVARVIQKPFNHDILKISFDSISPLYFDLLQSGVPVKLTWSQSSDREEWYGYVHSVSKDVASQKLQPMVITCIGSTFPLKERDNRVFPNSTASEAVQTLVQENGFRFIGDPSDRRFPQLMMAGHSYWEFIVEQARRIGFGIWVDGTDFYFRDLASMIDQTISGAPVLQLGDQSIKAYSQLISPTLDTFNVVRGDYVEGTGVNRAEKNVGGIDPITMQPHFGSASPSDAFGSLRQTTADTLFREFSDQVSDSAMDATSAARSAASAARFAIPAKATALGNPKVHPFSTVLIKGTGSDTDGYWVVQNTEHVLRRQGGEYSMSLSLATDGVGTAAASAFRSVNKDHRAAVNVAEALSRTSSRTNAYGSSQPVLVSYNPTIGASNQGYSRTPVRWTAQRRS